MDAAVNHLLYVWSTTKVTTSLLAVWVLSFAINPQYDKVRDEKHEKSLEWWRDPKASFNVIHTFTSQNLPLLLLNLLKGVQ